MPILLVANVVSNVVVAYSCRAWLRAEKRAKQVSENEGSSIQ